MVIHYTKVLKVVHYSTYKALYVFIRRHGVKHANGFIDFKDLQKAYIRQEGVNIAQIMKRKNIELTEQEKLTTL